MSNLDPNTGFRIKPRLQFAWNPHYGIDCSDPDPSKWQSFGSSDEAKPALDLKTIGVAKPTRTPLP